MGTTSSAPPGSSTPPAPSRPEGPARSCPPLPVPPSFSLPEASGQRGGAGAQRAWCPLAGVFPIRGTAGPSGHRPAPSSSPCPRTPGAALPPRPPGRTPPGSRARPLSVRPRPAGLGMRLDRGGGVDTRCSGQPCHTGSEAGGLSSRRLGFFWKESRTACLSLKPPNQVALFSSEPLSCPVTCPN